MPETAKTFSGNKRFQQLLQKEQVEKLKIYYDSVLKKDSVDLTSDGNKIPASDSLNIELNIMTPEFLKSVKKDNRRKFWEEKRKETQSNQEKVMIF